MARKTSIVAGSIKADELLGFQLRDAVAAGNAAIESLGGGSSTPVPYFGAGGVTYWSINSIAIADDDTDGNTCTMQWLVPVGTDKLTIFYKYIKANGDYGRLRKYVENDFTDAEIAAGFVEFTMPGIKANKSFDILKAVAKGDGARAANPISDPDPSTLATGAASVGTAPATTGGFPPGSFTPALSSDVLARVVSGDYAPAVARVTAVGTPIKEAEGVYFPVTVQFTAGSYVQDIKLRYERCGNRNTGTNVYADDAAYGNRPKFTSWHEVTDAERTAGSCIINVGPFGPKQARRTWHITRVRARSVIDEKNGDKVVKEKWPSTDADMATTPVDVSPVNSTGTYPNTGGPIPGRNASATNGTAQNPGAADGDGGAMLAILTPQTPITSTPSAPAATESGDSLVVRNTPDLDTEKDNDAIIELRCYVDASNHNATALDVGANECVFILARKGEETDQTKWKRFVVGLEDTETPTSTSTAVSPTFALLQFHRRIGRRWVWIKNVLRNTVSRSASANTSYEFQAGATAYTGTSAHEALTVAVGSASSTDDDAGMFRFQVTLTNTGVANTNSLPAIPKKLYIFKNRKSTAPSSVGTFDLDSATGTASPETGDTNWVLDQVISLRDQPVLATAAAHTITVTVKTRRKKTVKYYAACSAVGSVTLKSSSVGSYDTTTELPATNYAHGNQNLIRGGNLSVSKLEVDGGAADDTKPAKRWCTASAAAPTGAPSALTDIDTGTGDDCYWDKAGAYLQMKGAVSNVTIITKLRRNVKPGDRLTLSFLRRSPSGTNTGQDYQANLYHVSSSDGITYTWTSICTFDAITDVEESSTDWSLTFCSGDVSTFTKARYSQLWLALKRTPNTAACRLTNFMLVRGNQPMTHDISAEEADWGTTGEDAAIASVTYDSVASSAGDYDQQAGGNNEAAGDLTI